MKAVSLFSGGLDSIVSTLMMKDQGIEVVGLFLDNGFGQGDKTEYLNEMEEILGIKIIRKNIATQFTDEILFKPKYGYGKGFNPCVDCHANFIKIGWEFAKSIDAEFIFSGEVVGQRGMSQTLSQMEKLDNIIGEIKHVYLRPLSAKLLQKTIPEINGWVDREKLLDLSGKKRTYQLEFVKERNITKYESPAGGCLLTQVDFAKRMRLFRKNPENIQRNYADFNVLANSGRFFKIKGYSFFVGRNKKENDYIENRFSTDFIKMFTNLTKAPFALLDVNAPDEIIEIASRIISHYCKDENNSKGVIFNTINHNVYNYNPISIEDLNKYHIR